MGTPAGGMTVYQGAFNVSDLADTFLRLDGWGKVRTLRRLG